MFLRLQNATPKETWIYTGPTPDSNNVLALFDGSSTNKMIRRIGKEPAKDNKLLIPVTLNPALKHESMDFSTVQRVLFTRGEIVTIRILPGDFHRQSSLWNVYISDPPCRFAEGKFVVKLTGYLPAGMHSQDRDEVTFLVKSDVGLTIGDALKAAYTCSCTKFMLDGSADPNGLASILQVGHITLYIRFLEDDKIRQVIPTEAERDAVITD